MKPSAVVQTGFDFPKVTRVEVISNFGRSYTNYNTHNVTIAIQDNGRTIKVFLTEDEKRE